MANKLNDTNRSDDCIEHANQIIALEQEIQQQQEQLKKLSKCLVSNCNEASDKQMCATCFTNR